MFFELAIQDIFLVGASCVFRVLHFKLFYEFALQDMFRVCICGYFLILHFQIVFELALPGVFKFARAICLLCCLLLILCVAFELSHAKRWG